MYITYRNASPPLPDTTLRSQFTIQQVIISVIGVPGALLAGWMVELPYLGRKGTLALSSGTYPQRMPPPSRSASLCLSTADNPARSRHWRVPLREHDRAHIECPPGLELRLHVHEQRHVRRALRGLTRTVPDQGPRDGQRARVVCQPHLRCHGEFICLLHFLLYPLTTCIGTRHRTLRRPLDAGAHICLRWAVRGLWTRRHAATIRNQRNGFYLVCALSPLY